MLTENIKRKIKDVVKEINNYNEIKIMPDDTIIDMDQTVRWNRDTVARLNATVGSRQAEIGTKVVAKIVDLINTFLSEQKCEHIEQAAKNIIFESMHEEIGDVFLHDHDDNYDYLRSCDDYSLEGQITKIVNKNDAFVDMLNSIEREHKSLNTQKITQDAPWMNIRTPFTFTFAGIEYSSIFAAIICYKYSDKLNKVGCNTWKASNILSYIRKEKIKTSPVWKNIPARRKKIEDIITAAACAGLYEKLFETGNKRLIADDSIIGEYGSILTKVRDDAYEQMRIDFIDAKKGSCTL